MPAKPTPFSRPSIEIGAVKRVWKDVPAGEVRVGDTVADLGIIEDRLVTDEGTEREQVLLLNVAHARGKNFGSAVVVRAFVYE